MLLTSYSKKHARQFVEQKLLRRLSIFFIVFTILVCVTVYEIVQQYISILSVATAAIIGLVTGALFVRRKKIYWEEETSRVIARMDRIGIAVLIIYILFFFARHFFLEYWLHGHELTAFSLTITAGAMLGRLIVMRTQIRRILKNQEII